jgi:hypothetical protein
MGWIVIVLGVIALCAIVAGTFKLSQRMKAQKAKEEERLRDFRSKKTRTAEGKEATHIEDSSSKKN